MMLTKNRLHNISARITLITVILAFLTDNGLSALPADPAGRAGSATLAPASRFKPFAEKHGLDLKDVLTAAYTAKEIQALLADGALRDSHIARCNQRFPAGTVTVENHLGSGTFRSTGREYAYAVFHFLNGQKTVRALFIDNLTAEERAELRIGENEQGLLASPGTEGVWFVEESRLRTEPAAGGTMGRWKYARVTLAADGALTLHDARRIRRKDGTVEPEFLIHRKNLPRDIVLKTRPLRPDELRKTRVLQKELGVTTEPRVIERDASAIRHRIYGIAAEGIPFIREDILAAGDRDEIKEALDHEWREASGQTHAAARAAQYAGGLRTLIARLSAQDIFEAEAARRPEIARGTIPVGSSIAGKTPNALTRQEAIGLFPVALIRLAPAGSGGDLHVTITPPPARIAKLPAEEIDRDYLVPHGALQQTTFTLMKGKETLATLKLSDHAGSLFFMMELHPDLRQLGIGQFWLTGILAPYAKSLRDSRLAALFTCGDSAWDHFITGRMGFTKESRSSNDDGDTFHGTVYYLATADLNTYPGPEMLRTEIDLQALPRKARRDMVYHKWVMLLQNVQGSIEYAIDEIERQEASLKKFGYVSHAIDSDDLAAVAAKKRTRHIRFEPHPALARKIIALADISAGMPLIEKFRAYAAVVKKMRARLERGIDPLAGRDPDDAFFDGKADADRIHAMNLAPGSMPAIAPRTVLCHIITDTIVPEEQRKILKASLEQAMGKRADYNEKVVCLSGANAGNPARFIRDLARLVEKKRAEYLAMGYTDVRFDIACPSTALVDAVLGSATGVRAALAFSPCTDMFGVVQVEGIILALRALHAGDLARLKTVFSFLAGQPLSREERAIRNIEIFMRTVTFILPATEIEDYNKRRELYDLITTHIRQAA